MLFNVGKRKAERKVLDFYWRFNTDSPTSETYAGFKEAYKEMMNLVLRHYLGVRGNTDSIIENSCTKKMGRLWMHEVEYGDNQQDIMRTIVREVGNNNGRWTWDGFLSINFHYQRLKTVRGTSSPRRRRVADGN